MKALYGLTNKKDAMTQISKKYNRQRALVRNAERHEEIEAGSKGRFEDHHIISESRNFPVQLFEFIRTNASNPATMVLQLNFVVLAAVAHAAH